MAEFKKIVITKKGQALMVSCGGVDPAHWMASRYWLTRMHSLKG